MGFDLDAAEEEKAKLNREKVKYVKLGEGKHVLRMLPPPEGMKLPWKKILVARDVGPDKRRVVPPHQFDSSLPNPIQDEIDRLNGLGDAASLARAKEMRLKYEYNCWVIKRGEEKSGPMLWTPSQTVINQILAWRCDPENGDITDPVEGLDIKIEGQPATPPKTGTTYTLSLSRKSSPLGNNDWLTTNYFEKFNIGRPSDIDYIEAVIKGTVKELLAAKKAEREAAKGQDDTSFNTEEFVQQDTASLPTDDSGIKNKLDEIRNRGKAKAAPAGEVRTQLTDMLS